MSDKRKAVGILSKAELLEIGYAFDLAVVQRMSVDELRGVIAGSKRATLPRILPYFSRETLKDACAALGLPVSGSKGELMARIAPTDEAPLTQTALPLGRQSESGEAAPVQAPGAVQPPPSRTAPPPPSSPPAVMRLVPPPAAVPVITTPMLSLAVIDHPSGLGRPPRGGRDHPDRPSEGRFFGR